jgi:small subunit ribosomal protein S1
VSAVDTVTDPAASLANGLGAGKPVAGSDGLLIEVDGKIVPNYDATIRSFSEGDVVTGNVVRIDREEVLVDIGYKSEGVIPSAELSIRRSVDTSDEVSLGEEVDALVLTKEDQDGRLILSKKRARFERAWRKIEAAAESGEAVPGNVIEVVKGGLILDLGVRGFLPASLVDIRRVHNLDEFMGKQLDCRVIELNRSRNNVVLSRRAVLEEERKEVREQILDRLQPGQVVEGRISNIVDFGAFVDLEGIDGLIHISELSWSHVNHPSEVVAIGETVRVKVLDIDRDRQRISLGLKQTQEDPWQRVLDSYKPGESLEGKVTKVVAFGAFVQIIPGVEGLVHISELAEHHVDTPGEVVRPGDDVRVKILEIDEERRRMSLSIKRVGEGGLPMRDAFEAAEASAGSAEETATDADPAAAVEAPAGVEEGADGEPPAEGDAEDAVEAPAEDDAGAAVEPTGEADPGAAVEPPAEVEAATEADSDVQAEPEADDSAPPVAEQEASEAPGSAPTDEAPADSPSGDESTADDAGTDDTQS